MLKYPIPKEKRIAMVKLYLEVAVTPGMPMKVMSGAAEGVNYLTRSKRKLSIDDMRLPWKSLYKIIEKELFLCRRKFEIKSVKISGFPFTPLSFVLCVIHVLRHCAFS